MLNCVHVVGLYHCTLWKVGVFVLSTKLIEYKHVLYGAAV
jgi:hypothetical protein